MPENTNPIPYGTFEEPSKGLGVISDGIQGLEAHASEVIDSLIPHSQGMCDLNFFEPYRKFIETLIHSLGEYRIRLLVRHNREQMEKEINHPAVQSFRWYLLMFAEEKWKIHEQKILRERNEQRQS